MLQQGKKRSFALTLIASSILIGCNDSSSDPKLDVQSGNSGSSSSISGVALDGYLKNAKVCIDLNRNLSCDSEDGGSVLSDEKGQYSLPLNGIDLSQYSVIVEAIPKQTIDMDAPTETVEHAFVLSAPANNASLVTPYTTVISAIAAQQGLDFDAAKKVVSQQLNVDTAAFSQDYVAGSTADDQALHLLAQSLTSVMQAGEEASVQGGVSRLDAREGTKAKLALLDLAEIKTKTDKLVGTANAGNSTAIDNIARDYVTDVTISPDEMVGNEVWIMPSAPRTNTVNDAADTFDWAWVGHFTDVTDYEYSLDRGKTWQPVTVKPLNVGKEAFAAGDVQVRTRADEAKKRKAGKATQSTQPFTLTIAPAAPNSVTINDAINTFDWEFVPGSTDIALYEYSLDSGETWQAIDQKPQPIADIALPIGALQVRLSEQVGLGLPAGTAAVSTAAFTVTPEAPESPRIVTADDVNNLIAWENVAGFDDLAQYEVNLTGTWQTATSNPLPVGNIDIAANTIKVRVAADASNGRPAGAEAVVTEAFTKQLDKPAAPGNGVVDDAANLFDWENVAEFTEQAFYELSLDGGKTWSDVNSKPAAIPDENYEAGKICVRVKANAKGNHPVGEMLCSLAPFTETPATPVAPTAPVTNDNADTFGWTWTPGFTQASDYEIKIQDQAWLTATSNPHALTASGVYATGEIQVRVKSDALTGREAGAVLSNDVAFTATPDQPAAPTQSIVDDTANTFDWTFVPSFTLLSEYEYSLNGGQTWQVVSEKPVAVGEVNLAAGQVQVRVKANSQNGMPAGLVLQNTSEFLAGSQPDAPTSPSVVNKNIGEQWGEVKTNGMRWEWARDTATGTTYNNAEHYEYTNDGGTTWRPVTSNPQHIGPQAYDKTTVGLRVKNNAIDGKSNAPGKVMWATNATADFVALRVVPMVTWEQPASLSSYDGSWSSSSVKCYAEYDAAGQGEPQYWSDKGYTSKDSEVTEYVDSVKCGMLGWTLLSKDATIAKNTADSSYIPSNWDGAFIVNDDYRRYWATSTKDGQPTFVVVQNGQVIELSGYSSADVITTWSLPDTATLLSTASTLRSDFESYQTSANMQWQTTSAAAVSLIERVKTANKAEQASLLADIGTFGSDTETAANNLQQQIDANAKRLALFALYQKMLDGRVGIDAEQKRSILQNIETANTIQLALIEKQKALAAVQSIAPAMTTLTNVQVEHATLLLQEQALDNASVASDIHAQSLKLYEAIAVLVPFLDTVSSSSQALQTALTSLADSDDQTLLDALNVLAGLFLTQPEQDKVAELTTKAGDGLVRANDAGYVVAKADAQVGQHFSKLDIHGRYLPASTTYAQGWRCVLDNRDSARARTWTLLKDGLPQGKDDLALDASASGIPSVLGAGGLLEVANTEKYCGRTDWALPSAYQLKTLETATVDGNPTIDTSVFPHHLAMLPEYDGSEYSSSSTPFYYWTSSPASWVGNQYVYRYHSAKMDSEVVYDYTNGSENRVVMGRLVAELATSYQLIGSDGTVVTDINEAKCAYAPESKLTWQLFDSNGSERRKKYDDSYSDNDVLGEVVAQNTAQLCQKTNWRVPTLAELQSLLPIDTTIFRHNDSDSSSYRCYFTDKASGSNQECYDMIKAEVTTGSYYSSYMYRLVASD